MGVGCMCCRVDSVCGCGVHVLGVDGVCCGVHVWGWTVCVGVDSAVRGCGVRVLGVDSVCGCGVRVLGMDSVCECGVQCYVPNNNSV